MPAGERPLLDDANTHPTPRHHCLLGEQRVAGDFTIYSLVVCGGCAMVKYPEPVPHSELMQQ